MGLDVQGRCCDMLAALAPAKVRVNNRASMAARPAEILAATRDIDRVGGRVVAEPVTPVVGCDQVALAVPHKADRVAQAERKCCGIAAIGVVACDGGTAWI